MEVKLRVCPSSCAGSWTTWSTTWSWRSRTVRAGKATRPATTATGSTWLPSSCSATSRALTAQLNLRVKKTWSKHLPHPRLFDLILGRWLLLLVFTLQPTARYVSWRLNRSRCSWSTWRPTTNPVKCLMSARSTACHYCSAIAYLMFREKWKPDANIVFNWLHRFAITGLPSSQTWRHISEVSTRIQKTCSVRSASKCWERVTYTCSTTWSIRYDTNRN